MSLRAGRWRDICMALFLFALKFKYLLFELDFSLVLKSCANFRRGIFSPASILFNLTHVGLLLASCDILLDTL